MREVFLKNKEVLNRLNGFIKTIEGLDMSELDIKEIGDKDKVYATSRRYLQLMLNKVEQKSLKVHLKL